MGLLDAYSLGNIKINYFALLIGSICLIVLYKIGQLLYDVVLLKINTSAIPGPKGVPILGNAITLIKLRVQDQGCYLRDKSHQFKDGLYKLWIGPEIFICLTIPRHLEKIFPSTTNIQKNQFYDGIRPWLGNGLITSSGHQWFRDRKLLTPTFHFSILEKYISVMNKESQIMVKCIEKKIKESLGEPIETYDIVTKCALDILCSTSMGIEIHAQEQNVIYTQALHKFSELAFNRMFYPWFKYKWIYYLSSSGREYYAQLKIMHKFTRDVISKRIEWRKTHKDELQNENTLGDMDIKKRKSLLDHVLDTSDNATVRLTEDEVREQVDTFMFAGHDTTAAAFSWSLFCIGNSPDHQKKVHEELDRVFGDSDRPPTLKDLNELKYLDRVLKESLRMYPSVPIIGRLLTEDIDLGEYILPKGANVMISPFLTHQHPDVWSDPDKFDPDRFLPENMKDRHPYAYIPFSAGPRNCIGQKFASIEEKIMAVHILRKWKLKSALRHDQMETSFPVVLKPLNGIHIYFTPRK